jgi:hypothetical protein
MWNVSVFVCRRSDLLTLKTIMKQVHLHVAYWQVIHQQYKLSQCYC